MIESQLDRWCDTLDRKYNKIAYLKDDIYLRIERDIPTEKFTQIWLNELSYRKKYYLNVLMSVTGQQGRAFKSMFGLSNAYMISNIYGIPFDLNKHILVDPFDLDYNLKKAKPCTTFLVDEYQHKRVDIGSSTNYFALIDFEEQGRITQKNIILATPFLFDERHYFVFREHSHRRISNNKCKKCKKNDKCHENPLKTLCKIPFFKREGYPIQCSFMLWTHSKISNDLKPRGIVTLPIPTHQTLAEYNKIKMNNITKLEKDESKGWDRWMKEAEKIYKKDPQGFVKELRSGAIVPQSITFIEYKIRSGGIHGKYPKQLITYMAMKIIEMINNEYNK